jgi:flagellar hook-associated protein 3 FlgL
MLRTTFQSLTGNAQRRLSASYDALERANNRLSTGKQISRGSEDPASFGRAALLRGESASIDSYKRVGDDAQSRLAATETKLDEAMNVYQRITELGIAAANGTASVNSREAARAELMSLRDELSGTANSKYLGQPLFAGYASGNAVTEDTSTTPSTWTFTGLPTDVITRKVSDSDVVRVNVTAQEAFSFGGTDVFAVLDKMAVALSAGDAVGIMAGVTQMNSARSTLSVAQSTIGAATNRVTSVVQRNGDFQLSLISALSKVEDVDLADAITDQSRLNATYQAALGATAKTLQPSLVDWLR